LRLVLTAFLLVEYMGAGSFLSVRAGADALFALNNRACVAADVACIAPASDGAHLTIRWSRHERTGSRRVLAGLRWVTGAG